MQSPSMSKWFYEHEAKKAAQRAHKPSATVRTLQVSATPEEWAEAHAKNMSALDRLRKTSAARGRLYKERRRVHGTS